MVPKLHVGYIDVKMKSGNSDEKFSSEFLKLRQERQGQDQGQSPHVNAGDHIF